MCIYGFCCIPYKLLFLVFWQIYSLFNVWRYFSRESHESHEIKDTFCEIGEICVRVINMFLLFLCLNKDKKRKTFLVFTDNNHKRSKTSKNASKRASESAQLEKNNFSTEKKYFSNREIKFSQLAVSGFTAGFMSNCFFVKFFCIGNYVGKVFLG